jgi:predicted TIM-barrel fold metal-dependent hydrolase
VAEPIIDAHFHVDDVPALGWHMPASLALEQLDAAGVQTAVIMTITDAPEVNPTALEMIADVCAAHPGRFEAYARIHPWYGDEAERLIVRAIRELRFVGLKLHPVTTIAHPADESSLRLIRAAARLGAPTMIHCGDDPFCTPLELEQAALRVPEATIVFGHMGAYFHGHDALAVAERCDNVMLETSGCPYPELIREAVRRVGAERVIFGSDGPGCPPAIELDKVRLAGLSPADLRKVLYENQRALMDRVER